MHIIFFILDPLPELSFSCLLIFSNFSASVLLLSEGGIVNVFSTYYVIYAKFIGSLVVWFVPTQLQYGF